MKKVFIFEIKRLLIPLAVYLGIMIILGFAIMLTWYDLDWRNFTTLFGLFMLFLIVGIIYIVFSYNKKRISADMTYSLPVTKRELFIGKYLASLAALAVMAFLYLLICYIIIGLADLSGLFEFSESYQSVGEQIGNFTVGWLIHLVITIPLFNFLLLFYYKANTILDGIVFVLLGLFIVFLMGQIFIELTHSYIVVFPLIMYVEAPKYFLPGPYFGQIHNGLYGEEFTLFVTLFLIYTILGYLIIIYLIWFSKKDCSIRTQGICNGIFGYRVFLPLLGALIPIASVLGSGFDAIWFVLVAVGLFIGYCIYHRSIKFNKESYIIFASTLGFDFIFVILWIASL
ncbi:MAG: ABC-2 transporter permease [Anaeroplasmataceae bacterium]|nr:ABC-2 transporter permease [Anaeroplasmataceae bacterium]MDE6414812.1 ABC-2 transporter permease [Anaeroplasmataceae bacterium]